MKLLESTEMKTVLISAIISTIVCVGFNIGRSEVNKPVQVVQSTVDQPSIAPSKGDLAPAVATVTASNPQNNVVSTESKSGTPKSKDQWQMIANSLSPGFTVSRVEPIVGSHAINLVDDRKDIANLDSSILTVADDMSWWQDSRGFHLTIKDGMPLDDPRASLKKDITKRTLAGFPKAGIITYPSTAPAGLKTYDVYEFSSLDCIYCRHVSDDIAKYQATGLNIHVIPFPRTGPNSPAWRLAEKVWCATPAKRATMLHEAFASEKSDDVTPVADKDMPNPNAECVSWVKKGYQTAVWLNIPGTPGIFSSTGKLLGGYIPAENLRQVVEAAEAEATSK